MTSIKKTTTAASATSPPESAALNPYLNARQEWMERYGSYISRARQWRLTALLALTAAVLSLSGNVIQLTQSKIDRYFVVVDDLGKAVVEKMKQASGNAPERMVQATVAQAIIDWRTVTVDRELQRQMITRLNMHVAGAARGMMKQWYEQNSPYETAKKGRLVNVEIRGIPLAVSSGSYRVEWREVVRNLQGIELGSQGYEAIATIEVVPPQSEEILLHNPGGIYIVNLSTSKVLR